MSASGPSGPLVLISQPKHVVGTQKNGLNETVLLSTQNKANVLTDRLENIHSLTPKILV